MIDPGIYAARMIRTTLVDATELVNRLAHVGADRIEGAGISVFTEWLRTHEHAPFFAAIFEENLSESERLLRAASDFATSTAILLESVGESVVSPYVLGRSLGEAVMRLCSYIDPDATPARLLLRIVASQLSTFEGNLKTARSFGDHARAEEAEVFERLMELHGWLAQHGIERRDARRAPFTANLTLEGETENVDFNATMAYERYMPAASWTYNIGSGAAHSRGWMLPSLVSSMDMAALTSQVENAVSVVSAVLDVADALARTGGRFVGADVEWFLKKTHLRRRALVRLSGQGSDLMADHAEYVSRQFTAPRTGPTTGAAFRKPGDHSPSH